MRPWSTAPQHKMAGVIARPIYTTYLPKGLEQHIHFHDIHGMGVVDYRVNSVQQIT